MSKKPLPLIAIVLLVPVAVLALFAVRTLSLENETLNMRREHLAKQRMDAAKLLVLTQLQSLGTEVLAETHAAYAAGGADALSTLARKRVFTYAFAFKLRAPLYSATAFEHQYDMARALQDKAQSLVATLDKARTSAAQLVLAGSAYSLVRCSNGTMDSAVCIAVDSTDVTRTLRTAMDIVAQSTGLTQVGLVDPNGIDIGQQEAGSLGVTSQPLDGLLQGWNLRADDPAPGGDGLQPPILLYLAAGALIAGWLAMTWMLHRSSVLREEAAAARANVIAQLAHELRTPLTNLKLHTELLLRKSTDTASVERYGLVLSGEIDRLSNLAENAIAVARGAMAKPRLETAVPDECLRAILGRFEPTLADSNCKVQFTPGAGIASRFDRTSWERCIVNLIDNARKYAPGSEIQIATMQNSDTLRLDVSDRGPGIAANQREQIFEPLERGVARTSSGFGLGLAAVRSLAQQNSGNCWVEAMNPGARFVLTMQSLPLEHTGQEQAAPC
jgi:signal transduction histidine kinase